MALPINLNSGYNNSLSAPFSYQFASTKGVGKYSYPIGSVSGNSAPTTNKDYNNNTTYKHGSTRPQKWQYRRQSSQKKVTVVDPENPNNYIEIDNINNRISNSQKTSSLISNMIDKPGAFSVKMNTEDEVNNMEQLDKSCNVCTGISIVADFKPQTYLTNNPDERSTNRKTNNGFCCNNEAKAKKMVIYASTNLKNNYYNTLQQYRENRCLTYEQRAFNFQSGVDQSLVAKVLENNPEMTMDDIVSAKPGSPLASSLYIANCFPNAGQPNHIDLINQLFHLIVNGGLMTAEEIERFYSQHITTFPLFYSFLSTINDSIEAQQMFSNFLNNPNIISQLSSNNKNCKLVVYKPSNYKFACEGGVDSSLRTQKLTVETISKNLSSINPLRGAGNDGGQPYTPFLYKNKTEQTCSPVLPIYFRNVSYKNKTCFGNDAIFWKAISKIGNVNGV